MNDEKTIKIVIWFAGIIEVLLGIGFMLLDFGLLIIGYTSYNFMFPELTGVFLLGWGILLIGASRDIEKYKLIFMVSIFLHFLIIIPDVHNMIVFPEFSFLFLLSLIIDPIWGVIMIFLLKKNGYILK